MDFLERDYHLESYFGAKVIYSNNIFLWLLYKDTPQKYVFASIHFFFIVVYLGRNNVREISYDTVKTHIF